MTQLHASERTVVVVKDTLDTKLGVQLMCLPKRPVKVTFVSPDGPLAGKLEPGETLIRINGEAADGHAEAAKALRASLRLELVVRGAMKERSDGNSPTGRSPSPSAPAATLSPLRLRSAAVIPAAAPAQQQTGSARNSEERSAIEHSARAAQMAWLSEAEHEAAGEASANGSSDAAARVGAREQQPLPPRNLPAESSSFGWVWRSLSSVLMAELSLPCGCGDPRRGGMPTYSKA